MKIYALSDTHLSHASNKPMDIFGPNWENHPEKIRTEWLNTVTAEDVVLIAGDISWAMKLPQASEDLNFLAQLPGYKVVIKGNHDYWWASLKKISEAAGESFSFIQNNAINLNNVFIEHNAINLDNVSIAGSRLWDFPYVSWPMPMKDDGEDCGSNAAPKKAPRQDAPEKIRKNELNRLRCSLEAMDKNADFKICMTHYPPISAEPESNELTQLMKEFGVDLCVYGHLHALDNTDPKPATDCIIDGISFKLTSCDFLDFKPLLVYGE